MRYTTTILLASMAVFSIESSSSRTRAADVEHQKVKHNSVSIDGLDIFYREAGPPDAPSILLLHGFPTSSHMFRDLIPQLSDKYHLVAPDYPGFGYSSSPPSSEFDYTFDNLAKLIDKFTDKIELKSYSIYLMDYGAPIGLRLASTHPEKIETLIVQNGNAYAEGLDNDFWKPIKAYWRERSTEHGDKLRPFLSLAGTKWQYTHGVRETASISPDTWEHVQPRLDRPGNQEIQLALFYSYGSNPPLYPMWQKYFRKYQPPTLIVWGKNDQIFPAAGAFPYKRDLHNVELHLLDTGHFALEEDGELIAGYIRSFLSRQLN